MRRSTAILLGVVITIAVLAAAAVSFLHNGLSARVNPSALEIMMARQVRHMAIPKSARILQNPITDSAEMLRDARLHFADHCAICHANDGSCDTPFGRSLYPKPPDLRRNQTQKLTDGEIFWIIENGVRFTGMPAFGGGHDSQEDSWKLTRFIRHLPQLTAEERMEMEQYNPKSPGDREEEQEENEFLGGKPVQQKPEASHHHH